MYIMVIFAVCFNIRGYEKCLFLSVFVHLCIKKTANNLQIFHAMPTLKLYLDTRSVRPDGTSPLKLSINKNSKTALLSLDVFLSPAQWDAKAEKITNHPNKAFLNSFVMQRKLQAQEIMMRLETTGESAGKNATWIKNRIKAGLSGEDAGHDDLFLARFLIYAGSREKPGTRSVYMQTVRRMEAYDPGLSMRRFENITREWLSGFDRFMAQTSPSKNARNIHLRNIRAVFNEALDDELTTFYPFRKFKIRPVPTAKRSLTVEQLRMLFGYPIEDYQRKHLDMFKLSFFLVGINTVDLYNLSGITSDGRIEYVRAKTGRAYSIKVEPEALEIIEKYRGEKNLLDIADTYGNHADWRKRMNKALQKIGEVAIGRQGKKTVKPLFPHLTTYWARHTWATVAADLDIPKETIAAALGHGGNTVTDIYINFNGKKIDEANRKVMDWVLYGRK